MLLQKSFHSQLAKKHLCIICSISKISVYWSRFSSIQIVQNTVFLNKWLSDRDSSREIFSFPLLLFKCVQTCQDLFKPVWIDQIHCCQLRSLFQFLNLDRIDCAQYLNEVFWLKFGEKYVLFYMSAAARTIIVKLILSGSHSIYDLHCLATSLKYVSLHVVPQFTGAGFCPSKLYKIPSFSTNVMKW